MPCRSETKCARPGCEPVGGRHERHDVRARYASRTDAWMGQGSTKIRGVKVAGIDVSNVQTPTPNACSTFRRRTVSPFDPTDFDAP